MNEESNNKVALLVKRNIHLKNLSTLSGCLHKNCTGLRLFVSHPKLPVSSLFMAEFQWHLGTRKNVLRWTMHVVLKYAKTTERRKKQQRHVFLCRRFHSVTSWSFAYGGGWGYICVCVENKQIVSVNFQGFLYKSRAGSHSVATYLRTGTFWFLRCFRKRVLI